MNKMGAKIIASLLVFVMMFTYMSITAEVLAIGLDNLTSNKNVEFEMYFKLPENTFDVVGSQKIGDENYLYAKIAVKNEGYLKNANIVFENPNFVIAQDYTSDEVSKVEGNTVTLNQINSGETVEIAIPISFEETNLIEPAYFRAQNIVRLNGTYINGKAQEEEIADKTIVNLGWANDKQALLDMQVTKFIQYEIDSKKGVMLQTVLTSCLKDNTLPVKEEKIEISVPTIDNIKPEKVSVVASTKATNGDEEGINFTSENYTYDEEQGILTITVENKENENGKISWEKQAQDEFLVTFIYPENTQLPEDGTQIEYEANVHFIVVEASLTKASKTITRQETLKDQIGTLVDLEVKSNIETISKGQIYSNYDASKKYETEYKEEIIANISMEDLIDVVTINANQDNFVKQDNTKQTAQNSTYYKEMIIEKENFDKILSEEGYIEIYNNKALLTKIDKTSQVNEEGKIVVDLTEYNVSEIEIKTSDVLTEGKLKLEFTKAIKGEISFTASQMQQFKALELNAKVTANASDVKVTEQTKETQINFVEPTTNAEITIEPTNLSTVVVNNDVKLKVALKTDTLDCKLYKNPTLNIVLPKYIENINIKNVELFFETEGTKLTLKNYTLVPNADGTKTIQISLEGTQTEYSLGSVSKGLNVVVTSDMTVNKLTPNREETILMNYTNNYINKEEKQTSTKVNFVAPTGIVTISSVSNYADNANAVVSVNSEEKVATIPTMQSTRNAKFEMNLINNYPNTIDNVVILGRIPFEGNTNPSTAVNLGTTFDMNITGNITVSGVDEAQVKVYYSENANATKDLSYAANAWTETAADLSKVKSYLIVLENYILNTGEGISFAYDAKIPEGLEYNEIAYQSYVAYFNNNAQTGVIEDKASSTIGITTGRGPVIESSLSSNVSEDTRVRTDKIIIYNLVVKNTGTEKAENVKTNIVLPSGLNYVEKSDSEYTKIATGGQEVSIELGTIEAGANIEKEILMQVGSLSEDSKVVEVNFDITSDSISNVVKTNTVKNTLIKSYYSTTAIVKKESDVLTENEEYKYSIGINPSNVMDTIEQTVLEIDIPKGIEFQSIKVEDIKVEDIIDITDSITYKYDEKTRKLKIELGKVEFTPIKAVELKVKVSELEKDTYSKQIQLKAKVYGEGVREQDIKIDSVEVGKVGLKITQTSTITENAEIAAYEDFKYLFTIENLSNIKARDVKITDMFPQELEFGYMKIRHSSGTEYTYYELGENNNIVADFNIEANNKVEVEIVVSAKSLEETKQITNMAKLEYDGMETITSNQISHTILKYEEPKLDQEDVNAKRIMGQVWEDTNKNGIKDEDELKVEGVEVLLFNNQTGNLVKDSAGNDLKVRTDFNGIYTLPGVMPGKYTVIFLYDSSNYSATTYRKENVDATKNSDAIDTQITLYGVARIAAITEEIAITDSNSYNIDLGIVENKKFDLKLEKTVSKITVQDSEETKVYEYEDCKLAKKDLSSKKINDTTIVVEYKIKVTNEGAIPGYVKKIVDYMPEEMKFSSELNRDWYTSTNGDLYNSSLANTIINPGETKEVTLILSKKMSEDTLGLINNTAEIYEAYNDLGLEDVDSKEANKVSEEDDISGADILITVKTGETIMFIGLSLTIITILGLGAYFIKKKVLI